MSRSGFLPCGLTDSDQHRLEEWLRTGEIKFTDAERLRGDDLAFQSRMTHTWGASLDFTSELWRSLELQPVVLSEIGKVRRHVVRWRLVPKGTVPLMSQIVYAPLEAEPLARVPLIKLSEKEQAVLQDGAQWQQTALRMKMVDEFLADKVGSDEKE